MHLFCLILFCLERIQPHCFGEVYYCLDKFQSLCYYKLRSCKSCHHEKMFPLCSIYLLRSVTEKTKEEKLAWNNELALSSPIATCRAYLLVQTVLRSKGMGRIVSGMQDMGWNFECNLNASDKLLEVDCDFSSPVHLILPHQAWVFPTILLTCQHDA